MLVKRDHKSSIKSPRDIATVAAFLAAELQETLKKNPKYSLRRFATDAGVSSPYLSRILRGQRQISHQVGAKIARNLKWESEKIRQFLALVTYENAVDEPARAEALAALECSYGGDVQYHKFNPDQFAIVARWYHGAIMELATIPGFSSSPQWIAKRLKISPVEAALAIDRLKRVGAINDVNGKWEVCSEYATTGNVPSLAIRNYHKDILELTKQAIDSQSLQKRDSSNVTMAISPSRIPEAMAMIKKFRRELVAFLNGPSKDRAIYQLSIHLFQLDESDKKAEETERAFPKSPSKTPDNL